MNVCLIRSTPWNGTPGVAEERVYINAGGMYVSQSPALITTILSASVAVCLWSDTAAGMNHFVLPQCATEPSLRCADRAMQALLARIIDCGARHDDVIAAVFGGASLLGRRNVSAARDFLRRHDIPIIREDVGGTGARKLTFRTIDGSTIVRAL